MNYINGKINKKITLSFYADFGSNKGKGDAVYFMAQSLIKHNILSEVIVRDFNKKFKNQFPLTKTLLLGNIFPRIFTFIGKYTLGGTFSRYINDIIFDNQASLKLKKTNFVLAPLGMVSLFKKSRKKNIKTVLYSTGAHPEFTKNNISKNNKYHIKMLNRFLKSIELSDYIIVQSDFVKNLYIKNGFSKNKIFILPGAIKTNIQKLIKNKKIFPKKITYLYVGNIYEAKGINYLLKAWGDADIKNAELILCGEINKTMKTKINYYVKKHKNIILTGFKNPIPFYKKSSVFVFPSLSEGMARVNLEAMAMGLPVITTKESGSPVKNNKSGFIIPAKNSSALKEKMLYFYNNKNEIKKMGKNARKTVQNYTWNNFSDNFYKIIKKIINHD